MIPFIGVPGKGKSVGTANRSIICQGLGAGGEGVTTKWYEGTFVNDGKVLHLDCHDGYITVYICQNS